jgi:hypothetical protein
MRVIEAEQQPSGDWLVVEGRLTYVLEDEVFRGRWEPVAEAARRMWRGVEVGVEGLGLGRRG